MSVMEDGFGTSGHEASWASNPIASYASVQLGAEPVERAYRLAEDDLRWYGSRAGTYGANRSFQARGQESARPDTRSEQAPASTHIEVHVLDRHFVGHLGELATREWFVQAGHTVEDLFARYGSHAKADLLIDSEDTVARQYARQDADFARRLERWHRGWGRPRDKWGRVTDHSPPSKPPRRTAFSRLRVEVKTWRAHNWARYGRSINADQLFRIEDKADIIVWVQITDAPGREGEADPWATAVKSPSQKRTGKLLRADAQVMGWNLVDDMFSHATARWSPGLVAQARLDRDLIRPLQDLLPGQRPLPLVTPSDGVRKRCEHARTVRAGGDVRTRRDPGLLCWYCAWDTTNRGTPMPDVLTSTGTARFFHDPSPGRIRDAHGSWPFTATTFTAPAADVCRHLAACPYCFPRSLDR
jgi:hypothetical protein